MALCCCQLLPVSLYLQFKLSRGKGVLGQSVTLSLGSEMPRDLWRLNLLIRALGPGYLAVFHLRWSQSQIADPIISCHSGGILWQKAQKQEHEKLPGKGAETGPRYMFFSMISGDRVCSRVLSFPCPHLSLYLPKNLFSVEIRKTHFPSVFLPWLLLRTYIVCSAIFTSVLSILILSHPGKKIQELLELIRLTIKLTVCFDCLFMFVFNVRRVTLIYHLSSLNISSWCYAALCLEHMKSLKPIRTTDYLIHHFYLQCLVSCLIQSTFTINIP